MNFITPYSSLPNPHPHLMCAGIFICLIGGLQNELKLRKQPRRESLAVCFSARLDRQLII
ncbi:MAG: hypothetical protein ACRDDY_04075 [Clostridium sp.]|uniref:hypothetical protein n=1 Tax=Clostridium sp. TaxID=1506 RepID=UPI003EE78304